MHWGEACKCEISEMTNVTNTERGRNEVCFLYIVTHQDAYTQPAKWILTKD